MHAHNHKTDEQEKSVKVCLVGNPNVGKSAIFGLLTGRYVTVSNYPGTTVEVTRGGMTIDKGSFLIVDTPGVNSIMPMSEDEKVTRDILLDEKASAVIHVADAKNMKRSLSLTLQIIETGLPVVLDLNMKDEAHSRGIGINEAELRKILGIDTVSTIAVEKKGLGALKKAMTTPKISTFNFSYDNTIEEYIKKIEPLLPDANISKRSISLMLLSGDETLKNWLHKNISPENIRIIESLRNNAAALYPMPLSYVINRQRLAVVDNMLLKILTKSESPARGFSVILSEAATHPLMGFVYLLLVLYGLYLFVGKLGAGVLVDLIEDGVFGQYLNPWAEKIVTAVVPVKFIQELIIGPYGVITMALTYAIAIILPITATFFIAFAILEDSGYLPRLAAMLNKIFTTYCAGHSVFDTARRNLRHVRQTAYGGIYCVAVSNKRRDNTCRFSRGKNHPRPKG
ncbi:MAG: ferrous iron transporter B [Nitrospirae bacterium]|nr:ferrous iron transporter B [Nitrospirota bacterium]